MSSDLASSSSPAQLLYCDGVQSIFQFLSFRELLSALRVCSGWRHAASKGYNFGLCGSVSLSESRLKVLLGSSLRFHITALSSAADRSCNFIDTLRAASLLPRLASLRLRSCIWPNRYTRSPFSDSSASIASIDPESSSGGHGGSSDPFVQAQKNASALIQWPRCLRDLDVSFRSYQRWQIKPAMLLSLCEQAHLQRGLTSLRLNLCANLNHMQLEPLLALQSLKSLRIVDGWSSVTPEQLRIFQRMQSLTELDLGAGSWRITSLFSASSSSSSSPSSAIVFPNLKRINMDQVQLDAEVVRTLCSCFPALTDLRPAISNVAVLPFLKVIPMLQDLKFAHNAFRFSAAVFLADIVACASTLRRLDVARLEFSAADFEGLMASLPLLDALTLRSCVLPSTAATAAVGSSAATPLAHLHLTSLGFDRCVGLSSPLLVRFDRLSFPCLCIIRIRDRSLSREWLSEQRALCAGVLIAHCRSAL
jgi:hypothetical protein